MHDNLTSTEKKIIRELKNSSRGKHNMRPANQSVRSSTYLANKAYKKSHRYTKSAAVDAAGRNNTLRKNLSQPVEPETAEGVQFIRTDPHLLS